MRRLRANEMAVSQKTYLELDELVSSWIGTVVAMVRYMLGQPSAGGSNSVRNGWFLVLSSPLDVVVRPRHVCHFAH